MRTPWLEIPLADYESHMALPHVGQAQLLADIFSNALNKYSARSAAVLGCAGGNGLDRVDLKRTPRLVCVDINPDYVEQVRVRFQERIPQLEAVVGDVQVDAFSFPPVDLVFTGLLFEYVDIDTVLARIRPMLTPDGVLVSVVQLPSPNIPEVTPSPFTSLRALSASMRLVSPESLTRLAAAHDLREIETRVVRTAGGKDFQVQVFRPKTFEL